MAKNKRKNSLYSTPWFRFLGLTTIIALSLLGFKNLVQNYQNNNVLGTTTLIAERGSGDSNTSGSSKQSESTGSSGSSDDSVNKTSDSSDKQDEVKLTETPEEVEPTEAPEPEHISQFSFENLKELSVRTEENKTKIRLDSKGGSFELKNEDGKLKIKAKEKDGKELELESETIDNINDALKEEGISVASASGNKLRIRRGLFEAETHFPLSINPTTNTLTVTTPAGVKDVAVLPDQAVTNLLRFKFIDRIASGSAEENPTGIKLGLLGNNPVFQVLGVDEQRLLGFIPVSINKTSFVSAENGSVVKVDETFLQRLLDLFSF